MRGVVAALGALALALALGCEADPARPVPAPSPLEAPAAGGRTPIGPGTHRIAKLPPGALDPPAALGLEACDAYARRACECRNERVRPLLCATARASFVEWRRRLAGDVTEAQVEEACRSAASSLRSACPD